MTENRPKPDSRRKYDAIDSTITVCGVGAESISPYIRLKYWRYFFDRKIVPPSSPHSQMAVVRFLIGNFRLNDRAREAAREAMARPVPS